MIKPDMIPPDAMYAAWKAMNAGMTLNDALAAAINAWPGMWVEQLYPLPVDTQGIILPLPKEPT